MSNSEVAKRYALALFELAQQNGQVESIQADLVELGKVYSTNIELEQLLSNPRLSMAKKKELLLTLFNGIHPLIQNTLFVMLEKNRLTETVSLVDAFIEFANETAGVADAKVFSTRSLTEEEKNNISTAFAGKVGRNSLRIENIIDPTLIGGFRLQIGNRIYDGSLSGKLEQLKRNLIGS